MYIISIIWKCVLLKVFKLYVYYTLKCQNTKFPTHCGDFSLYKIKVFAVKNYFLLLYFYSIKFSISWWFNSQKNVSFFWRSIYIINKYSVFKLLKFSSCCNRSTILVFNPCRLYYLICKLSWNYIILYSHWTQTNDCLIGFVKGS